MTHSGGKPHTNVGDRGQRFEVRATGYPKEEQSVIGWADDINVADDMAAAIREAPGCVATAIFDRDDGGKLLRTWHKRRKDFDPACRTLAEHFLQDEPTLRARADELAGEVQQCVEEWIKFEKGRAVKRRHSNADGRHQKWSE